jgi:twinkle protein
LNTWASLGIVVPAGASGNAYTTCPQCSSTRKKRNGKCLSISVDKGLFNCHHCGWCGSLDEGGRRSDIEHWAKPKWRAPEKLNAKPELPSDFLEWWSARGISANTLGRCHVKVANTYVPLIEECADCHVFPYFVPGPEKPEVVNRKYRMLLEKAGQRMETGARIVWYGLERIVGAETVVIVEGEPDALAVVESGTFAVISVPHGAPQKDAKDYSKKFDFIAECEEYTRHVRNWVIWVDNDAPGKVLEAELVRRLGVESCRKVTPVEGCKDANDVLIKHGKSAVQEAIATALPWPVEGEHEVGHSIDRINALYETGLARGQSTGWSSVDENLTIASGQVTIVTGIPNSGKSNWVDAVCVNLAKYVGWHSILCSPENQPIEDHMARICEKWSGKPFDRGPTPRMTLDELTAAEIAVHNRFSWLLPDNLSLPEILSKASSIVKRKGSRVLVLDPWNEMDHSVGDREDQYLQVQLKLLKQWARKHDCHVFVVAHPKTMTKDKSGNYGVPTPYDISGGAMWRNKADNCVAVWRDFEKQDGIIEIHIQKVRFRQIGKIGCVQLRYLKPTATYEEVARNVSHFSDYAT